MATTLTPTFRPRTTWSASLDTLCTVPRTVWDVAVADDAANGEDPRFGPPNSLMTSALQCPANGGLPDSLAIAGVTTFLTVRCRADGPSGPSSRHRSYSRPC